MLLSRKWLNHYVQIDDLCSKSLADTLVTELKSKASMKNQHSTQRSLLVKFLQAEKHRMQTHFSFVKFRFLTTVKRIFLLFVAHQTLAWNFCCVVACVSSKLPDGLRSKAKSTFRAILRYDVW